MVVDIEDGVRKGFTVKDVQNFLQSVRYAAPMSLIVVDSLDL